MITGLLYKVRVDKKVKPIHFKKRNIPALVVGGQYFVSFGCNDTYPCTLAEIITEYGRNEVRIEIPVRPRSKKGYIDRNGNRCHRWISSHILYAEEIALTREEAVINTVSS